VAKEKRNKLEQIERDDVARMMDDGTAETTTTLHSLYNMIHMGA
jgi:hypothetical protein